MTTNRWIDPNVCILIHPTAFSQTPGWCAKVQELTERGLLKRHYLRFGPTQGAHVQAMMKSAPLQTRWKVITNNARYILVQVTFTKAEHQLDPAPRAA